jgi:hypothetical protein
VNSCQNLYNQKTRRNSIAIEKLIYISTNAQVLKNRPNPSMDVYHVKNFYENRIYAKKIIKKKTQE